MSESAIEECGATTPTGLAGEFVCNRYKDHDGDHEAHYQEPGGRWVVLAHWSDEEPTPCNHGRVEADGTVTRLRPRPPE